MKLALEFFQPSSPRWFLFPGHRDRGFFIARSVKLLPFLVLFSWVTACSVPSIDRYAQRAPAFDPRTFFSGFITAHGVIKDFRGEVTRTFNADIDACWTGDIGTLDERFVFDDGEKQTRLWTLRAQADSTYLATAGDVIGDGHATTAGNAFFLDYVLRVQLADGDSIDLRIDDRMYRVSENVVINQSVMNKFGLEVGEILLTLVRHPEQQVTCAPS